MDEIKLKFCKKCGCETERYPSGPCKPCHRKNVKNYRETNAEKHRADAAAYRSRNKEYISEQRKRYCEENKGKISDAAKEYYRKNKHKISIRDKLRYSTSKEKAAARAADYYRAHREKIATLTSAWSSSNRHTRNALQAKRRAAKMQATPKWADQEAIKAIYAEAARIQRETGTPMSADHIVPLQSPIVCGLHCEANLQILTKSANSEKSNRWWPDMP